MKRVYRSLTSVFQQLITFAMPWGISSRTIGGGGGVGGQLPKTLIQLMTKICDIPYPIYDDQKFETLFMN